jgi:hypothetical protein
MAFADLVYYGALASAGLFSSVVLLRQFLRGDLADRWRTAAVSEGVARRTPRSRRTGREVTTRLRASRQIARRSEERCLTSRS